MTKRALSAAPPSAILTWTDGRDLFIELPGPDDAFTVIKYPLTVAGYQSALGLIRSRAFFDGAGTSAPAPRHARSTAIPEAVYNDARAILRQLRLVR
jgi:hypothetical protein